MRLKGKKAVITGASQSIGQAIAIAMAKEGAEVVFSYRENEAGARETIETIGRHDGRAHSIKTDFLEKGQCKKFIENALDHLGHIDILVNNAGAVMRKSFFEITHEDFLSTININSAVPLILSQIAAKHMVDEEISGCIINISSIAGLMPHANRTGYASSKACLNMITKSSALELAPYNIRVNGIAPGFTASGMNEERASERKEEWNEIVASIPLQRGGTPKDHAELAVFLASDESSWITGVTIPVDGGSTISFR